MGQKVGANVVRVKEALVCGEWFTSSAVCMWPGPRLTKMKVNDDFNKIVIGAFQMISLS